MAIDFFDRELLKLQDRFNSTFGENPTFKPDLRACTMLSICWLGMIDHFSNGTHFQVPVYALNRLQLADIFDTAKPFPKVFMRRLIISK